MRQSKLFEVGTDPETGTSRLRLPDEPRIGKFMAPEYGAPETQRQAAILAYPRTGTQRRLVLTVIAEAGECGATDYEIERALGGRHQAVSARRNELMNDGWIEDSGQRRKTDSGTAAVAWVLSRQGRREYWEEAS